MADLLNKKEEEEEDLSNANETKKDEDKIEPRHEKLDEGDASYQVAVENCDNPLSSSPSPYDEEILSATSWESLHLKPELLKGIYNKGFPKPSKVQAVALPLILASNNHMIAQAKNGAGKTATFSLAIIAKVDETLHQVQAIVISPSRELALQNLAVIQELGQFTQVTSCLGSPPFSKPEEGAMVISGTPGKVRQWMQRGLLKPHYLKLFVLDEADTMLEGELGSQVADISRPIQLLNRKQADPTVQILLFSATFPEKSRRYATAMAPRSNKLTMKKETLQVSNLRQYWVPLADASFYEKVEALKDLLEAQTVNKTIVFCNQRDEAAKVANILKEDKHSVTLVCGTGGRDGLEISEREKRMDEFRQDITRVLVTTDLLSRGIDVPAVSLVVNFDLPREYDSGRRTENAERETYLHRVGRTARFGKRGFAVSFICTEADKQMIDSIRDYYQATIIELPRDFEELQRMLRAHNNIDDNNSIMRA